MLIHMQNKNKKNEKCISVTSNLQTNYRLKLNFQSVDQQKGNGNRTFIYNQKPPKVKEVYNSMMEILCANIDPQCDLWK